MSGWIFVYDGIALTAPMPPAAALRALKKKIESDPAFAVLQARAKAQQWTLAFHISEDWETGSFVLGVERLPDRFVSIGETVMCPTPAIVLPQMSDPLVADLVAYALHLGPFGPPQAGLFLVGFS